MLKRNVTYTIIANASDIIENIQSSYVLGYVIMKGGITEAHFSIISIGTIKSTL